MSRAIKCDRCGVFEELEDLNPQCYRIAAGWRSMVDDSQHHMERNTAYHLCPGCGAAFDAFMRGPKDSE